MKMTVKLGMLGTVTIHQAVGNVSFRMMTKDIRKKKQLVLGRNG